MTSPPYLHAAADRDILLTGPLSAALLVGDDRVSAVEHVLAPRALGAPVHTHRNEDEYSFVLEGELGVEIDGNVFTAEAGSVVAKPRGVPHAFWNPTARPVRLLELIVPGGFERYFGQLGPILERPGPPDVAALEELAGRYGLELDVSSIPRLVGEHGLDLGAGSRRSETWEWDELHAGTPPWETEGPQPALARLAEAGLLSGRVLDVGCGSGDNALLAAAHGADVLGVDVSPRAVEKARAKAAARGSTARFEVADALELDRLDEQFDVVLDSGMFHVLPADVRPRYAAQLRAVLRPGGICRLLCFNEQTPGSWGPQRVSRQELHDAFADGWSIESIDADVFELPPGNPAPQAHAWLAAVRRA